MYLKELNLNRINLNQEKESNHTAKKRGLWKLLQKAVERRCTERITPNEV